MHVHTRTVAGRLGHGLGVIKLGLLRVLGALGRKLHIGWGGWGGMGNGIVVGKRETKLKATSPGSGSGPAFQDQKLEADDSATIRRRIDELSITRIVRGPFLNFPIN